MTIHSETTKLFFVYSNNFSINEPVFLLFLDFFFSAFRIRVRVDIGVRVGVRVGVGVKVRVRVFFHCLEGNLRNTLLDQERRVLVTTFLCVRQRRFVLSALWLVTRRERCGVDTNTISRAREKVSFEASSRCDRKGEIWMCAP